MSKFSLKDVHERKAITRLIIEPMLKGKRDTTVKSTYKRILPGEDGRIHTVLSSVATSTFRLASAESPLFDASTNLQNMANKVASFDPIYKVRECLIPDEGKVLVAWDYSGAEAVAVAAYMRDWPFLDELLSGVDVHSKHGRLFFNLPELSLEEFKKKWPVRRRVAKDVTYGSFYHGSARTLSERMNKDADQTGIIVSEAELTGYRAILLQLHPLERWWQETREELHKSGGQLRNCFGYRRVFRNPDSEEMLKEGLNFFPQSTVAWLQNEAVVTLEARAPELAALDAELLLQIHDELLFQVPEANIPALAAIVVPIMTRRFTIAGRELYIPVEGKKGVNWGSMKAFTL